MRGLGSDYVLGRRIAYRHGAVEAPLRPSDASQISALLPGKARHAELMAMIALYIGTAADVYVRLIMPSTMARRPRSTRCFTSIWNPSMSTSAHETR